MKAAVLLALVLSLAAAVAADGDLAGVEPSTLLPLSVGNSWTYRWSCPAETRALAASQSPENPTIMLTSVAPISYGGRELNAHHVCSLPVDHEEKYVVVENVNGAYRLEIKTTDDVPVSRARDGRYDGTKDIAWLWRNDTDHRRMWLSEDLTYDWNDSLARILLRGATIPPDEFPTSRTNLIDITLTDGVWGKSWTQVDERGIPVTYLYRTANTVKVEVLAGTYDCIETITQVMQSTQPDAPVECETHSFISARVGLVREYQVTGDGVTIYDMVLCGLRLD